MKIINKLCFFKEKEYELSEVFDMSHDAVVKAEVLSMSEVNKYSYQVTIQSNLKSLYRVSLAIRGPNKSQTVNTNTGILV